MEIFFPLIFSYIPPEKNLFMDLFTFIANSETNENGE